MTKYNIEYMKKSMSSEGYTLLSTTYSSIKKLKYVCNKGHSNSMLVSNWVKGRRCPECEIEKLKKRSIKQRVCFSHIKQSFLLENYKLLTNIYTGNKQKLYFICPNKHRHFISWGKWQQGQRCGHCAKNAPITINMIKKEFERANYTLISNKYKHYTKLKYICDKEHKHLMMWSHFQQGKRCPTCHKKSIIGQGHWNWQGGISSDPYCPLWLDKQYKADIKQRDNTTCQNPYCSKKDDMLVIHHINYNKKDCKPGNLITICRSCNSYANKNRAWHEAWYNTIMYNKGLLNENAY